MTSCLHVVIEWLLGAAGSKQEGFTAGFHVPLSAWVGKDRTMFFRCCMLIN